MVIAIIAILAAMLLPLLARAKQKAQAIYCLNNTKQLAYALLQYTADHGEWLPPNEAFNDGPGFSWVSGFLLTGDATNLNYLIDPKFAKLAPYTGPQYGIYKCPSDKGAWTDDARKQFPRVRSYTMSQAVGTKAATVTAVDGPWLDGNGGNTANHPWRTFGRMTEMTGPSPAGLWLILDEDQDSIHDASFAVSMVTRPTSMIQWPGTRHNFSGTLDFADGHAEIHHWTDGRTKNALKEIERSVPQGGPDNPDILWIQQRTSSRAQ